MVLHSFFGDCVFWLFQFKHGVLPHKSVRAAFNCIFYKRIVWSEPQVKLRGLFPTARSNFGVLTEHFTRSHCMHIQEKMGDSNTEGAWDSSTHGGVSWWHGTWRLASSSGWHLSPRKRTRVAKLARDTARVGGDTPLNVTPSCSVGNSKRWASRQSTTESLSRAYLHRRAARWWNGCIENRVLVSVEVACDCTDWLSVRSRLRLYDRALRLLLQNNRVFWRISMWGALSSIKISSRYHGVTLHLAWPVSVRRSSHSGSKLVLCFAVVMSRLVLCWHSIDCAVHYSTTPRLWPTSVAQWHLFRLQLKLFCFWHQAPDGIELCCTRLRTFHITFRVLDGCFLVLE